MLGLAGTRTHNSVLTREVRSVPKELWETFSVADHMRARAFVAEILIYDQVVVPTPFDDETRDRWQQQGRDPGRQERLLGILGTAAARTTSRFGCHGRHFSVIDTSSCNRWPLPSGLRHVKSSQPRSSSMPISSGQRASHSRIRG
jgi:hypothetical protein